MEPIISKGLRAGVGCLVFVLSGSAGPVGAEGVIATLATGPGEDSSWACTAEGAGLSWSAPNGLERSLAAEFVAACDPIVDDEGRWMYFSGRRFDEQGFRIWRVHLITKETTAMTPDGLQPRLPLPLPDGSMVFIDQGELFRRHSEADRLEQLTFSLGRVQSAAVLPDGRILYLLSSGKGGRLFSMLPDGTWSTLWPGLNELVIGDFTVVDKDRLLVLDRRGDLWIAAIADPYAAPEPVPVDLGGTIQALHRADEGRAFLVAEMGGKSEGYSTRVASLRLRPAPSVDLLRAFDGRTVLAAAASGPSPRADILPSIVKPEMETGFLFVIDVARTDDPALVRLERDQIAALKIYRMDGPGSRTALSTVEPASDGSVYLQAPADTPLALELIDRRGEVLAATRTPIWVRPNERRGCVGCHVSPAYAPPNIRPQALVGEPHRVGQAKEVSP